LERFRQELLEFFKKNEEFFKRIPNGVYTGFRFCPNRNRQTMPDSVVAVLGYPKKPEDVKDYVYPEIHLLHQPIDSDAASHASILQNRQEILNLLRFHKEENRYVPKSIDKGSPAELKKLSDTLGNWIKAQAAPVAISEIQNLFSGKLNMQSLSPEHKKTEEKFQADNFDLITWFVISK
jgi:hypothetical protein